MGKTLIRRIINVLLVVGVVVSVAWPWYLDDSFLANKPRVPQVEFGRVFPLRIQTVFVYVNQQELAHANFVHHEVFYFGMFCVLIAAFVNQYFSDK